MATDCSLYCIVCHCVSSQTTRLSFRQLNPYFYGMVEGNSQRALSLTLNWPACLRHTQSCGMSSLSQLTATHTHTYTHTTTVHPKDHLSVMYPLMQQI